MKTITFERILSRITLLAVAGIILSLLYKADANAVAVTLTVFADPEASGTITVNDEVLPYPNGSAEIDEGASVTLVANQANGYVFSQWNINVPELVNGDQYSSSISFIMPNEGVEAIAHFQSAPAPDPSQPAESSADPPKSEEPPRDEIEEIMEQTSDSVGNVASTVNQINLATDLAGFAVSTPKTDLIKDYLLKDDEDILVKVSNFDAKKSPDCKKAMDIMAGIEGLSLGPAINFEIGMVDSDDKYTAFNDTDCTVEVKLGLKDFPNAFGVLEITETGVRILGDLDNDPNTVTVNASCRNSTLVVIKSSYQITEEYLETLQKELLERLAALSDEQADIAKAESDKAELNQKIGDLSAVQKELSDKLTALSNDNRALEQKKVELENKKAQLTEQLEVTNKSLSAAVTARDKYQEKYKNATAAPKRKETPSRAQALSKNNAVGDGKGGYIAQGGHVQINGGKSNVTFTLAAPTSGVLSSANKYANSVGGTLLHCVTTSSPGVSFKTATANFTVTGVYANDTIAVYQLQGKNWVQVMVSSVTDNHVTVNLTQHGPLAFVRVAAVATATH
ncbi:MAG: hypothetical protein K5868_00335 [Lachnospiraceae bacterium]|nr:hypothetical protein [Lachnospiraceae bacterium]